jgi:hypothetical protein
MTQWYVWQSQIAIQSRHTKFVWQRRWLSALTMSRHTECLLVIRPLLTSADIIRVSLSLIEWLITQSTSTVSPHNMWRGFVGLRIMEVEMSWWIGERMGVQTPWRYRKGQLPHVTEKLGEALLKSCHRLGYSNNHIPIVYCAWYGTTDAWRVQDFIV